MSSVDYYMGLAFAQAEKALAFGEVPVGAVIVKEGEVISQGFNQMESLNDPTAHAEILAIRSASNILGSWRLSDAQLYVTLEPCPMCAGAIVASRLGEVFFGADDPIRGAFGSLYDISMDKRVCNYPLKVISGVMKKECEELLRSFFDNIRDSDHAGN